MSIVDNLQRIVFFIVLLSFMFWSLEEGQNSLIRACALELTMELKPSDEIIIGLWLELG